MLRDSFPRYSMIFHLIFFIYGWASLQETQFFSLEDKLNHVEFREKFCIRCQPLVESDPLLFCVLRCQAIRFPWWPTKGWPRTCQTACVRLPSSAKSTESKTAADPGLAVSLARIFWTHERSWWVGAFAQYTPAETMATHYFSPEKEFCTFCLLEHVWFI